MVFSKETGIVNKFVLIAFLLFSGCALGPNYHPPENQVLEQWSASSVASQEISEGPLLTDWWKAFEEPLLTQYIEKAAVNNYDLRTAEANILQARAMRNIAASSFYPKIGADVNATRLHFSKNGLSFGSESPATSGTSASPSQTQNFFTTLFDAIWEIDFFGKTRRSVEAAEANIGSAIEQRNDVLITILAEVARNYIEIRSNQCLFALVEENVALLEQEACIIKKQFESGYVSLLNYETIQSTLSTERALLPDIKAKIYQGIYALSILTGDMPEALVDELTIPGSLPKIPQHVAVGIRSDLLRRRPDVRRSERQLAAATANIGVAIASFFPSVLLYGVGGLQSTLLRNLFKSSSGLWALGGNANIPLFEGGKLVGNFQANKATATAAAYSYQQTVLNALEETESAIVAYAEDLATTEQLLKTTKSNQILVDLTRERHRKGLINRLNLLDSERQLNSAEQSLLQSQFSALTDLIILYKALGGGWEPKEITEEVAPCSSSEEEISPVAPTRG